MTMLTTRGLADTSNNKCLIYSWAPSSQSDRALPSSLFDFDSDSDGTPHQHAVHCRSISDLKMIYPSQEFDILTALTGRRSPEGSIADLGVDPYQANCTSLVCSLKEQL